MKPFRSMKSQILVATLGVGVLLTAPSVLANKGISNAWSDAYPDSLTDDNAGCLLCHNTPSGTGGFNAYGIDYFLEGLVGAESIDSDGDPGGCTNIEEINNSTQPGWTPGAPPSYTIAGDLDPDPGLCGDLNNPPDVTNPSDQLATENQSISLQIDATDQDGDSLSYSAIGLPPGLTINPGTGLISGTVSLDAVSHPNITQDYNVGVSVDDGNTAVTVNFTWTVDDLNRDPVALDDSAGTLEDTPVAIPVLDNDSDADGDSLVVSSVTSPSNGSVINNGTSITYTPDLDFDGQDTFEYVVFDGYAGSDVATVTVNVTTVNDPPALETPADQGNFETDTVSLQIVASDPDGDSLTYGALGLPANLAIDSGTGLISGTVSYDAVAHPAIQDVYSVTVQVDDGVNPAVSTGFDWTITDVNRAPVAVNDGSFSVVHDTSAELDVLANDSDADGDSLIVLGIASLPANGTLTINADDTLTYTPDASFVGGDSFTYTIDDGFGETDEASVELTVTNEPPVAVGDVYGTDKVTPLNVPAPGVLGNDSDADGDVLSSVLVSDVSNGTLTLNADGSFSYQPGAIGQDSFTYVANDGISDSNVATVTINVSETNLPPEVVNPGTQDSTETDPVSLAIVASDPNGDVLSYSATGLPTGLEIDSASGVISGSLAYEAVAHPDTAATFAVTVDVADGRLVSSVNFDWNIDDLNQDPDAVDDSATTGIDTPVTVAVLSNDSDADGDTLAVTVITVSPLNGTVVVNNDDSITYTPEPGFASTDSFTYEIEDGFGGTDTAVVNISVLNEAPVAQDDAYSVDQDTILAIAAPGVLANDSDADGDVLTAILQTAPSNGSVILNANGSFVYEPAMGFIGTDSFSYLANDGFVDSNLAVVTITVTEVGVNEPPVEVTTDSDNGGGCTIGNRGVFDPALPLLVLVALLYLVRRRVCQGHICDED